MLDAEQQSISYSATRSSRFAGAWYATLLGGLLFDTARLRRDSLKANPDATLGNRGRYALGDLGIRHGVYAAIPLELGSVRCAKARAAADGNVT
jgi:hypothetical protein